MTGTITRAVTKAAGVALSRVEAAVLVQLRAGADAKLNQTAPIYKDAITVTREPLAFKVTLDSPLARALEVGWEPFDIKTKMLARAQRASKTGAAFIDVPVVRIGGALLVASMTKMSAAMDRVRASMRPHSMTAKRASVFRRISANSPPSSWWHPGFKGVHLLEEAKTSVDIKAAFEVACVDAGLKVKK